LLYVVGYVATFTNVLMMYLRFTSPSFPFIPLFNSSHCSVFLHEYTIFPLYSPPSPFPYILPTPTATNPPDRTCFYLPVLHF
jgi:hypothetical protein